ncbi:MAG: class B sortase [Ruminococcus sp.]|nr:class B sortase [Ruminococcus sp.]
MRTELYSVRSSAEEMSFLNKNLRKVVKALSDKTSLRVLYKTEIDYNPRKIKADLIENLSADNPPELYIYVNALDTQDDSSFRQLFHPLIERLEKELPQDEVAEDGKTKLYPHIKVYPLIQLAGSYPAYCFVFRNKKILALPRISLVGGELISYLCDAVSCAKDIFDKAFTECPEGFVFTTQKPRRNNIFSSLFAKKEMAPVQEVTPVQEAPAQEAMPVQEEAPAHKAILPESADENIKPESYSESSDDNASVVEPPVSDASATLILEDDFLPKNVPSKKKAEEQSERPDESEQSSENSSDESFDTEDTKGKRGFKAFLSGIFPVKGDSKGTIIRKIIIILAVIGFITGAYLLLDFYVIKPWKNNTVISEIQNIFYETTPIATDAEGNYAATPDEKPSKNWKGLKEINEEIVGWIKLDGTNIDYPVLFHKEDNADSQFYIYRNYKKQYSDYGSIFVDYRCTEGAQSRHLILHGHNMSSDKAMFDRLLNYARYKGWTQGNVSYYKEHPVVKFDTPEQDAEWIIFAAIKVNVSNSNKTIFNYLQTEFANDAQYMNFIYNIKERSYLDIDVPINEDDRLLTLSTCSYESQNTRTVIVARMVREGEKIDKYVKSVKQGEPVNTVYSSFSQEFDAGNIKWYDKKERPEGDESLEYMPQSEMFTVKFLDGNGNVLSKQQVLKGKDAKPPKEAPRKTADGTYYYTFKKWDTNYKNVTKDLVIKPIFDKHLMDTPETTARETDPPEIEYNPPVYEPEPTPTTPPTKPPTEPPTEPPTKAPTAAPTEAPTPAQAVTEQ